MNGLIFCQSDQAFPKKNSSTHNSPDEELTEIEADSKAGQAVDPLSEMQVSAAASAGAAESKAKATCLALSDVRFVSREWTFPTERLPASN